VGRWRVRGAAAAGTIGLITVAGIAYGGPPFSCCVCRETESERVIICRAFPTSQFPDFEAGCTLQGGMLDKCLAAVSPQSCGSYFAEAGCTTAEAPAVGKEALFALAALLGGVGAMTLRMRGSPDA
jgi:hypothetical protein